MGCRGGRELLSPRSVAGRAGPPGLGPAIRAQATLAGLPTWGSVPFFSPQEPRGRARQSGGAGARSGLPGPPGRARGACQAGHAGSAGPRPDNPRGSSHSFWGAGRIPATRFEISWRFYPARSRDLRGAMGPGPAPFPRLILAGANRRPFLGTRIDTTRTDTTRSYFALLAATRNEAPPRAGPAGPGPGAKAPKGTSSCPRSMQPAGPSKVMLKARKHEHGDHAPKGPRGSGYPKSFALGARNGIGP
jgi:hypothetical protein